MTQRDKAGVAYWDGVWRGNALPAPFDPQGGGSVNLTFHRWFRRALADRDTRGVRLLEIGSAASIWLPYFAREFGFEVHGLDYSEPGCAQTRAIFDRDGIDGGVHHADAFAPPEDLLGSFDVVVSFGVVEHFTDTAGTVEAFARFLRPGGLIITEIPNLKGFIGTLQRRWNPPVWDVHVPLDRQDLLDAHSAAGLTGLEADYLVYGGFGVVNLNGLPPSPATRAKRLALGVLNRGARLLRGRVVRWEAAPDKRGSAGYVICCGCRPAEVHLP